MIWNRRKKLILLSRCLRVTHRHFLFKSLDSFSIYFLNSTARLVEFSYCLLICWKQLNIYKQYTCNSFMGRFIPDLYFRFQGIIYSNDLSWKWTVLIKSVPSKTMLIEIHTRTPFNIKVLEFFPLDCLLSILSDSELPETVQFWSFGPSTFNKSDRPLMQTTICIHLDSESWTIWTLVYYASIVM